MRKLLSLVLSVSILFTSVTPTLGNGWGAAGRALSKVRIRPFSRAGKNSRWASNIGRSARRATTSFLKKEVDRSADILNQASKESPHHGLNSNAGAYSPRQPQASRPRQVGQRAYPSRNRSAPSKSSSNKYKPAQGKSSPRPQQEELSSPVASTNRQELTAASTVAMYGASEQHVSGLLDFYERNRGTSVENTSTLITARGLLRMEAYDELGALLVENADNPVLAGTVEYIRAHDLPVEVPASLQGLEAPAVDLDMAAILEEGSAFPLNRLNADASLSATEQWMQIERMPSEEGAFAQNLSAASVDKPVSQAEKAVNPTPASAASEGAANSSRSGNVNGGASEAAAPKSATRWSRWVRKKFKKKETQEVPYEERGLHDNKVRPIYEKTEEPPVVQTGEEALIVREEEMVPVGADGFQLTITDEHNVEHILHHVNLTISSTLKNFSAEYNRLALDINNIFELRNLTLRSKRPDHFYFAFSNKNGEIRLLAEGAEQLNLSHPMRIKIQQTASPRKAVTVPVYDVNLKQTALIADVDVALLRDIKDVENGQIIFHENNLYFRNAKGEMTLLEDSFIRLPKEESKYWTKILAMYPQTRFELGVFSTMDKMPPVTYLVPTLQVGLGKTLAPVLHDMSSLGEASSTAIMMGINNVLPALMGFVHPFLKRYGEAAVYRTGAAMFTAGGLVALLSGLYGHVGTGIMSHWQLAGFLTSSVFIALGTNITRFVQNIIISANRGIVPLANSFKKKVKVEQGANVTYNLAHLARRTKEVFTKKSQESLRDVVYYQRGAMFKNLGTMLFLSYPWLANLVGKAFGVDLGLDFSASYVPYTLYSLYTLYRLKKIPYKDAFPLDLTRLKHTLQDTQHSTAKGIAKADMKALDHTHPTIQTAAKQLKESIDALVPVEARSTKKAINGLVKKHEARSGEVLEQMLRKQGRSAEEAQQARVALQKAFDVLGHRDIKLKDVMLMAGLPTSLIAMTLATFGELGLSNGLAFAMRELVGNGTAAAGIVGILLYGCMFGWRIIGNLLSQRMSGGSMYALSSAAGILGPAMMAFSHGSAATLISGAIIACFGISNFFSQMFEYMVGLHPKYKREIALLINYTMPIAAFGTPLLRLAGGIQGLDMGIAGAAMAGSVALTPAMLANSSLIRVIGYGWKNVTGRVKRTLRRRGNDGNQPPLIKKPAH